MTLDLSVSKEVIAICQLGLTITVPAIRIIERLGKLLVLHIKISMKLFKDHLIWQYEESSIPHESTPYHNWH